VIRRWTAEAASSECIGRFQIVEEGILYFRPLQRECPTSIRQKGGWLGVIEGEKRKRKERERTTCLLC